MDSSLTILYYYLTNPLETIKELGRNKVGSLPIIIVILSTLSSCVGGSLFGAGALQNFPPLFFFSLGFRLVLVFLGWFLWAGILHFLASILRGKGKGKDLFLALGYTFFPGIFLAPLALIFRGAGDMGFMYYSLFYLFILIWILYLQVITVKEVHNLKMGKALLAYFAPIGIGIGTFFLLGLLLAAGFFTLISYAIANFSLSLWKFL